MPSAIVLYHSLFGNTKTVAKSLVKGLVDAGIDTDCLSIEAVDLTRIPDYDFLAIGGPTHMLGISKPLKEFFERLRDVSLKGISGFSFDTRNESRMNKKRWLFLENSAARRIEGKMKRMKIEIVKPRQSALVHGREGPLEPGVEETFMNIGREIGAILAG